MAKNGRRPVNAQARERLREAQQREAGALASVEAADLAKARAEAKLQAVMRKPLEAIQAAQRRLACAQADLVAVSGLSRAASLLDMSPSALRPAVRTARAARADASAPVPGPVPGRPQVRGEQEAGSVDTLSR